MKYCVRTGTSNQLEKSEFNSDEIFLQNAQNSGFAENEVEIITEEEFLARKELEPILPQALTEIEQLRLEQAQSNAELFEMMLMLTGGGF